MSYTNQIVGGQFLARRLVYPTDEARSEYLKETGPRSPSPKLKPQPKRIRKSKLKVDSGSSPDHPIIIDDDTTYLPEPRPTPKPRLIEKNALVRDIIVGPGQKVCSGWRRILDAEKDFKVKPVKGEDSSFKRYASCKGCMKNIDQRLAAIKEKVGTGQKVCSRCKHILDAEKDFAIKFVSGENLFKPYATCNSCMKYDEQRRAAIKEKETIEADDIITLPESRPIPKPRLTLENSPARDIPVGPGEKACCRCKKVLDMEKYFSLIPVEDGDIPTRRYACCKHCIEGFQKLRTAANEKQRAETEARMEEEAAKACADMKRVRRNRGGNLNQPSQWQT